MLNCCVLLGLDLAEPMMLFMLHITCSCIFMHTYLHFFIFIFWFVLVLFCVFLSLPLSFFRLVALWHLNENLLRPGILFDLGHLLLLILLPHMFDSMMIKPDRTFGRTFLDEAFIRNTKSFCQTSPTLTYPLSFTIVVGSHCVMSWSLVHPCLYRSSTPTCMDLIIQYLSLSLAFEVRTSWSLQILYLTCSRSRG